MWSLSSSVDLNKIHAAELHLSAWESFFSCTDDFLFFNNMWWKWVTYQGCVTKKRDFVYSRRYNIETWLSASRSRTKRRMFERKKKTL